MKITYGDYSPLPAEIRESRHALVVPVDNLEHIVFQTVRQDDIARPEHRVVAHGLRQNSLVDRHVGSLALDKHQRAGIVAHNHDIGTLRLTVQRHGILLDNAHGSGSATGYKVGDKMAAHPFLGSEDQINSPKFIPHLYLLATVAGTEIDRRKIQFGQSLHGVYTKIIRIFAANIRNMRTILSIIALFSITALCAQPPVSHGMERPGGTVIPYPTAAEAVSASLPNRFVTPVGEWQRNGSEFTAEVTVPFAWANHQVLLHVDSASAAYEVRINDRTVGYNANGNNGADFNITRQAREGINTLKIILSDPAETAPLESWKSAAEPQLGDVWLASQPTMRIRDILVGCTPSGDGRGTAVAEVGLVVKSGALNSRTTRFHYELLSPNGRLASSGYRDVTLDMRGEDTVRFLAHIPDSMLWQTDRPLRYTLRLRTQHEGRNVEFQQLPVAFRTIAVEDGRMAINGRTTALRTHAAEPSEVDTTLLKRLRGEGINTLRLKAGATPDDVLDLCDAEGFLVIVQAAVDTRSAGNSRRRGGNPSNNPAWREHFAERADAAYNTAKRHPSVIAFSIADDSSNGICLYESYLALKRYGDPRPILYPAAAGEWNSDFLTLE